MPSKKKSQFSKNRLLNNNFLDNKIFKNQYFLYFIGVIAFINLLTYLFNNNFTSVILFVTLTVLGYLYSKNMSIVLLFSIILTAIINNINNLSNKEGYENNKKKYNKSKHVDSDDVDSDDVESDDDDSDDIEETVEKQLNNLSTKKNQDKKKEKYQNYLKLNPKKINNSNSNLDKTLSKADSVEKEYDDLENVISKYDVKNVSDKTKSIMSEQKKMISELKEMAPMIENAMSSIDKVNMSGLSDILKGMTSMTGVTK